MAKTIQVRVDDQLKETADVLFASLGLDTSTAIRMFLVASMEAGGLPFTVAHSVDYAYAASEVNSLSRSSPEPFAQDYDSLNTPPLDNAQLIIAQSPKMSRESVFGCMRGQFEMTDDFDAPLEDFREYME